MSWATTCSGAWRRGFARSCGATTRSPGRSRNPPPDSRSRGSAETSSSSCCTHIRDAQDAATVAARLTRPLMTSADHDCPPVTLTASVGIAVHSGEGASVEALLRQSGIAMYSAKRHGRGEFAVLRCGNERGSGDPIQPRGAARGGTRAQRVLAALPAAVRPRDRPDRRRRGAAALDESRARQRVARRVHSAGGGDRPDPADRRVGARSRLPAASRMDGHGPAGGPGCGKRVARAVHAARLLRNGRAGPAETRVPPSGSSWRSPSH